MDNEQVKQMVYEAINESGVSPEQLVTIGQMAEQAISNKTMYPMVVDALIRAGLADSSDVSQKVDYQMLGIMAMLGKAASQMQGAGGMPNA